MICFLQTVMPVTLHVCNQKVIENHIKNANKISSTMNDKSWHSLRILNDGRSALCEEKNQSVQWNTHFTREMSVDCSRFFDSSQQQ